MVEASDIRLVLTDVDGVLTDGTAWYGPEGEMYKRFSFRDGMAVERLRQRRIETGFVSGEDSPSVRARARKLGIELVYLGVRRKRDVLTEILDRTRLAAARVAYIGDDVNDLELLRAVGFSASPADAVPEVLRVVRYVCRAPGGAGAFREVAEVILSAQTQREGT